MTVSLIRGLGAERDNAERELADAGFLFPLSYRAIWAANLSRWEPWFLLVSDAHGRACAGVGIEQVLTRAMPGYRILRVRRFGDKLPNDVCSVVLDGLSNLARKLPRILRVQVQIFSREKRGEIAAMLARLGYRELSPPTVYRHTLVIDLKPSEEEIFAKINTSGRQNIRKTMKNSLKSVTVHDPIYANRLKELQQEALQRTGGHIAGEDWRAVLKLSQERPELSQVFGLFVGEDKSPENMAAFGWVCNHGDHGEYRAAGSTRRSDVKISYGYLVVWDMIRWAKATGADWFDMGGVTVGEGDAGALEGISNFKKSFSREVAEVGAEWILEPRPLQARIADAASEGAQRLRRWMARS
jgi:lipid II:glycine glycyltransferase (peptidoglycan interpeptide bridge formation enzyme)